MPLQHVLLTICLFFSIAVYAAETPFEKPLEMRNATTLLDSLKDVPFHGGVEWSVGPLHEIRKQGTIAIPALLAGLLNNNVNIRCWSVMLLGSPSEPRNKEAMITLAKDPKALDKLLSRHRDPSPLVQRALSAILPYLHDKRVIAPLIALVNDADTGVSVSAIWSAGVRRDAELIPSLVHLLPDTRQVILPSHGVDPVLNIVGQDAAMNLLRMGKIAEAALKTAVKSKNSQTRIHVLIAISYFSTNDQYKAPWMLDAMLTALTTKAAAVRTCASIQLRLMLREDITYYGDRSRAVTPLLKALTDKLPAVRRGAAFALENFRNKRVTAALIGAIRDTNIFVRLAIVEA